MMRLKDRIKITVDGIMADSRPAPPFSAAGLLQQAARLFEGLARTRAWGYGKGFLKIHRLPCTVISIGNITSGGTGKTPMTLYVAQLLRQAGYRVVIISRGYKGEAEKRGGIVSDGKELLMTSREAGDEPHMMARFLKDIPVLVGQNRFSSGRLAISRFAPDIILLDDGFQHRRLHRDLDIVLLDTARPFGNGFLLPRGSLREPPDALDRADMLVFTRFRDGLQDPATQLPAPLQNRPIFRSRNVPYIHHTATHTPGTGQAPLPGSGPGALAGTRVFAFSAIADNPDFHRAITNLGCRLAGKAEFPDHHAYTPRQLEEICRDAGQANAELIMTTQKDFPKLPGNTVWPLPLVVLGVLPSFTGEENGFDDFLLRKCMGMVESGKAGSS
jgi:tetraacyldisaccharide 4'-kinase